MLMLLASSGLNWSIYTKHCYCFFQFKKYIYLTWPLHNNFYRYWTLCQNTSEFNQLLRTQESSCCCICQVSTKLINGIQVRNTNFAGMNKGILLYVKVGEVYFKYIWYLNIEIQCEAIYHFGNPRMIKYRIRWTLDISIILSLIILVMDILWNCGI